MILTKSIKSLLQLRKKAERASWHSGGFLFIGFMLGITFILGAALIIYYKQISEGAEDKRSYRILQEVGLTKSS